MPKRSCVVVACAAAGVALLSSQSFVPAPKAYSRAQISAVAGSAAALGAAPAFADEIGEAAKRLSKASYPFLQEIDWNSYVYQVKPGSASALEWLKAIDKAIVMGTAMDSRLLKAAVIAHSNAIRSVDANGVTSLSDYTAVNEGIGRIVASVPKAMVMDVYNAFDALTPSKDISEYMMSKVNSNDAKTAYLAFMEFKGVVENNQVTKAALPYPAAASAKLSKISEAAATLSAASYPFAKDVDWTSDLFTKPLPGATAPKLLQAVDKALIMGAAMDGKLLKEAGEAHHKAIASVDANGMTSQGDWEAILASLGKVFASVPAEKTMATFNAFGALTSPVIPNNIFQTVTDGNAIAAFQAFLKFKDVVRGGI